MGKPELLRAISEVMRTHMAYAVLFQDAIARQAGINSTDLQCLNLLVLNGPMTPTALSDQTGLSGGGAITAAIDRLERAGLAQRVRATDDRRKVLVAAETAEAGRRIGPLYASVARRWQDYLNTLDATQLQLALDIFNAAIEISQSETAALRTAPTKSRLGHTPPA